MEGATAVIQDTADSGEGLLALTPIRCWSPTLSPGETAQFRFAKTCHQIYDDWYGIAAVFRIATGGFYRDDLYYLVVDGWSTSGWPGYGRLYGTATRIASEYMIDSVDCTTDDNSYVFVAWDRPPSFARWVRMNTYTKWGPYDVNDDCGGPGNKAHRPRIGYSPDGHVVVAYHGYPSSCNLCYAAFDAISGVKLATTASRHPDSNTPQDWDLEWNGLDKFVVSYRTWSEGIGKWFYIAFLLDSLATVPPYTDEYFHILGEWEGYTPPRLPTGADLVYSNNGSNLLSLLLLVTDRTMYWVDREGYPMGGWNYYSPGPNLHYDGCEYWGPSPARTGHTYTDRGGAGSWYTVHRHWHAGPTQPMNVYNLNSGFDPAGCASSDQYEDAEVLVVSYRSAYQSQVCWNIEAED